MAATKPVPRDANGVVSPFADGTGAAAAVTLDGSGNVPVVQIQRYAEDVLFNSVAITDTSSHASTDNNLAGLLGAPADCRGFRGKTIIFNTTLNQAVTVYVDVSRDGTNWVTTGNSGSQPANAGYQAMMESKTGAQPGNTIFCAGLDEYWPYLRVHAICGAAPTSGALSVWLEKAAV